MFSTLFSLRHGSPKTLHSSAPAAALCRIFLIVAHQTKRLPIPALNVIFIQKKIDLTAMAKMFEIIFPIFIFLPEICRACLFLCWFLFFFFLIQLGLITLNTSNNRRLWYLMLYCVTVLRWMTSENNLTWPSWCNQLSYCGCISHVSTL